MRSAEIARLAGVTVRTLRHYHQVGVLAEPPRTSNGYRDYSVQDLVRVLRIRQLSGLGLALEQMPPVLDGAEEGRQSSEGLLDELDQQLAQEIERLSRQRELVAHLRSHGAAPDLPAELAPFYALFLMGGYPRHLAQMDRDQAILLSHFAGEQARDYLEALYRALSERPELVMVSVRLSQQFDALDERSGEEDIGRLVEDFLEAMGDLVSSVLPQEGELDLGRAAELVESYGAETYTPQQQRALTLLARRLEASAEP